MAQSLAGLDNPELMDGSCPREYDLWLFYPFLQLPPAVLFANFEGLLNQSSLNRDGLCLEEGLFESEAFFLEVDIGFVGDYADLLGDGYCGDRLVACHHNNFHA